MTSFSDDHPPTRDNPHAARLETRFEVSRLQSFGDMMTRTSRLYRNTWRSILLVTLVLVVPFDLVVGFCDTFSYGDDALSVISSIVGLAQNVAVAFASPAVIYAMIIGMRDGREVPLGEALSWGGRAGWRTLGYRIVYGLILIAGFLLLIVPGLLFMVWYALTDVVVAAEGRNHPGVFARSKELTEGNRWRLFGGLLVLGGLILAISMAWGGLEWMIWSSADSVWSVHGVVSLVVGLTFSIGLSLFMWVFTALSVVVYMDGVGSHLRECPGCGYNLTGNVSGACPECGRAVPAEIQHLLATPPS